MTRSPWPYFSVEELACGRGECKHCGGKMDMNPEFMMKVVRLRREFNRPMVISSGFRCEQRNRDEGGKPGSAHLLGRAVDICVKGRDGWDLSALAFLHNFPGIGWNQKGESRFIHLDDLEDGEAPRPWIWSY